MQNNFPLLLTTTFNDVRTRQPVTHMRLTNQNPMDKIKSRPIRHNSEEKTIAPSVSCDFYNYGISIHNYG